MFGLFRSKGVTHLRSVHTDYELINQVYQKLKDLNNSEINSRKGLRDNNTHKVIEEMLKQLAVLGSIDYLLKIKTLRVGELNKSQEEVIKKRIQRLNNEIREHTKEHKNHVSKLSGSEKGHAEFLNQTYRNTIQRLNNEISHLRRLLNETEKIRKNIRSDTKRSIEDCQRVIYNV